MIQNILLMTLQDIKNGYSHVTSTDTYICNTCGEEFRSGEIFEVGGRYFDALKMAELHVLNVHKNMMEILADNEKKYTGLTENQKNILRMVQDGLSDAEIAKKMEVAPSTVRHQKFVFREKAKQAKLYLSIYELAVEGSKNAKPPSMIKPPPTDKPSLGKPSPDKPSPDKPLPAAPQPTKPLPVQSDMETESTRPPETANQNMDKYPASKAEEGEVLITMFSSLSPLKLKTFDTNEKNQVIILKKISLLFERNKKYSENQVNNILKDVSGDFDTIRKGLVKYGFMAHSGDLLEYWMP